MGRIRKEEEHKDEGRGRTKIRDQARVFDGLAEELFESPEPVRKAFTAEQVRTYLDGGTIEQADEDSGPDLEAIRDRLCDPDTFEDALASAHQLMPVLDTQAIRRYAEAVHESDDRRAFAALYKTLRQAADALAEDDD